MPVLEAMASGIPVIIGNRGAAPEIAGGHAVAVNPDDTEALRRAIDEVPNWSPERRTAAMRHAAGFRWEHYAGPVREAYQWVLDHPRGQ